MHKMMATLLGCWCMFAAAVANAAPTIQAFEPDGMARIVASQKGKPFVLIIWSLDCEYCQASLTALAHERLTRKALRVVTLSMDALGDVPAATVIRKKLARLGMTGDAWAFGTTPAEQLRYAIDPQWHGEMPRSYWFNAGGEKIAYSGVLMPATIETLLLRSRK